MDCGYSCFSGSCGSCQLDYTCATNSSGTTANLPAVAATAGGVINSAQNPLPAPDASGGNGTFPGPLQGVLTQGLNDTFVSATEFGLGALNDRIAVAAQGFAQPAAAPSPAAGLGFAISPMALLLIGGVILFFVLKD